MNTIAIMIGVYFLARWAYGLGGSRNIDNVLPWLRIGRWRAHKILPLMIFVPFVAWLEGWILSTSWWPDFGSVTPRFTSSAPIKISRPSQSIPEIPRKEEGMTRQEYAKLVRDWRIQRETAEQSRRTLDEVLSVEDINDLGDFPRIIIPKYTKRIELFAIEEDHAAESKTIANGWFQRLTVGMGSARYTVITRCGFDLGRAPAERVCFSALPAPIFLNAVRIGCAVGKVYRTDTRKPSNETVTRTPRVRNCDYPVNMPWVLLRMDKQGVTVTGCVYNTFSKGPRPCDTSPVLLGFKDALADNKLDWPQYNQNGETVTLELKPNLDAGAESTATVKWSERQIMRNHRSMIDAFRPSPEPIGTITHDVQIPKGHLAAMEFLGAKLSANQVSPAWDAVGEVKALTLQTQKELQNGAAYPNTCRVDLGSMLERLEQAVAKHGDGLRFRNTLRIASSIKTEPRDVRIEAARCHSSLPFILSRLL